jgi:hypothetical protein
MSNIPVRIPSRVKERGGTVKQWLLFAILAAGLASAAMNIYLMRHRTVVIHPTFIIPMPSPIPQTHVLPKISKPKDLSADYGVIHVFPDHNNGVCTFANNICSTRI